MKIGKSKSSRLLSWLLVAAVLFPLETLPATGGVRLPNISFTSRKQPMIERVTSKLPIDKSPHFWLAPLCWNTNRCQVPIQHVATESIKPEPLVPVQPKPLTPLKPQPLIVIQPKPLIPAEPKPRVPVEPKPLVPIQRP